MSAGIALRLNVAQAELVVKALGRIMGDPGSELEYATAEGIVDMIEDAIVQPEPADDILHGIAS